MPYKCKEMQRQFLKEWGEEHLDENRWRLICWRRENKERNDKTNHASYMRNRNFYLAIKKLKRKLDKEEII